MGFILPPMVSESLFIYRALRRMKIFCSLLLLTWSFTLDVEMFTCKRLHCSFIIVIILQFVKQY
jgi:hypothetical protein